MSINICVTEWFKYYIYPKIIQLFEIETSLKNLNHNHCVHGVFEKQIIMDLFWYKNHRSRIKLVICPKFSKQNGDHTKPISIAVSTNNSQQSDLNKFEKNKDTAQRIDAQKFASQYSRRRRQKNFVANRNEKKSNFRKKIQLRPRSSVDGHSIMDSISL